ncbi:hypothetical protein Back11_39240 [Paenibacillus baekrokdamisoli]|uniref:Methyltransferase domain-containing protein n=1 Tax=Paenibacillus baekrokdamisoli TaxID=1712516 RepID=A0A3G9JHT1_9BACL|nr:class I SAM-dependent methyltransferase [Paenibacillus baekrokdamisoli]MBB3068376.1 SAM-dependent methyltransferase [Paenibacillus baekrokdamisoli]BBH22579.1 hypothetical protein Back11_39240 [Paenibacillus baekrokdamisoli]
MDKNKKYSEINKEAWEYATTLHQKARQEKGIKLEYEMEKVFPELVLTNLDNKVNFSKKKILQICCNNGLELIALKKNGANLCVGVDISSLSIEEARINTSEAIEEVKFYNCDIYDLQSVEFEGMFDIVLFTTGSLRWLHDLDLLFQKVFHWLAEDGQLVIYDMHPITEIINDDRQLQKSQFEIIRPYFFSGAQYSFNSLDYIGHTNDHGKQNCWFMHKTSDIVSAIIENNFSIKMFKELPNDIAGIYNKLDEHQGMVPLSYLLIGQK